MKKLFTFFAFVVAFFTSQHILANSKTFYAKATVQVAEESTGRGVVYFDQTEKTTEATGNGSTMDGSSANVSFNVFITPAEGYKFDKFTENSGQEFTFNADTEPQSLVVTADSESPSEPSIFNFTAHFVPASEQGGEGETGKYSFTKNISTGSMGYSTMVVPADVTLPSSVVAYQVTGVQDATLVLQAIEGSTVPAGTCVLLENTGMNDATIKAEYDEALNVAGEQVTGLLHGYYTSGNYTPTTGAYDLQGTSGFTFKKVPDIPIAAFDCYLAYDGEDESIALKPAEGGDPEPEEPATGTEIEVSEAGYATTYFDAAKSIPAGVTVYTISGINSETKSVDLSRIIMGGIPANTGVLLEAPSGKYTFENGSSMFSYNSMLKPIAAGETVPASDTDNTNYVLQKHDDKLGFYKVVESNITVSKNSAYLNVPVSEGNEVAAFFLTPQETESEETAISALNALTSGKADIHDANGRKLNKLQKGINIVNGVKILVK